MNAYYAIANDYFREMEGWHLYPGLRNWLSWAWAFLAIAWIESLLLTMQHLMGHGSLWNWRFGLLIILELMLLLVTDAISTRKHSALFGASHGKKINRSELDELRTRLLCKHLKTTPDNFLEIVKEIKDLKVSRKEFRQASEIEWSFFLRKLYDPDSKPRVLAVFLAGLTILTALALRSAELPTIFETVDSLDFQNFLVSILATCAMFFLLFLGMQALGAVIWTAAATWMAKMINTRSNDTALRYLVRDLVILYRPKRLEVQSKNQIAAASPDAPENANDQELTVRRVTPSAPRRLVAAHQVSEKRLQIGGRRRRSVA